jgi:hypothetical protein
MAKADTDPTTADESRGAVSIQLTFRDWVFPWLRIHYLGTQQRTALLDRVKLTPALVADPEQVKAQVETIAPDTGLLGRMRGFEVVKDAVTAMGKVATPPAPAILKSATEAVSLKQAIEAPVVGPQFSRVMLMRR